MSHYNQVYLIDHEHLSIIRSVRSPLPWHHQQQQQPDVDKSRDGDVDESLNDAGSNTNSNIIHTMSYCLNVGHHCFIFRNSHAYIHSFKLHTFH